MTATRTLASRMLSGLIAAAIPFTAAAGQQNYTPSTVSPDYRQSGNQYDRAPGYPGSASPASAGPQAAPPPPPFGYDGSQPPPPPPGYQPDAGYARQQQDDDRRYEAYAEDWAQRYCVKAPDNTGTGAVIGGLLGAIVGSGVAGRGDHAAGALVGGVAGAAGGAAIASTSSYATSPGCPPGYVVPGGAPAFYYDSYAGPYLYAAPAWYRPWVFTDGRWIFRPYPYHLWYYRRYGYGRPAYGNRERYWHRGF